MAKARRKKRPVADSGKAKTPQLAKATAAKPDPEVHVFGRRRRDATPKPRGHATPQGRSPLEIVVDASEGFIPLWAKDTTLRWRFREQHDEVLQEPGGGQDRNPQAAGRGAPGLGRRGAGQVRRAKRRVGLRDRDAQERRLRRQRVRPGQRLLPRRRPAPAGALPADVRRSRRQGAGGHAHPRDRPRLRAAALLRQRQRDRLAESDLRHPQAVHAS